jgi:pimeloyl-ACP methyl ester carboxylesterase
VAALVAFGGNANPKGMQRARDRTVLDRYHARTAADHRILSPQPDRYEEIHRALARMWQSEPAFAAEDLARIRAPVLVIAGQHDEIVRLDHTRWIAQSISGAEFVLLERAGHFAMLQTPEAFNAAVSRFLHARR